MLMEDAGCSLINPLLLSLDSSSQSIIFGPSGIEVSNLCIQVNFLLSFSDFDLTMCLVTLIYSRQIIASQGWQNGLVQWYFCGF